MRCDEVRTVFSDLHDETLTGAPLVTVTQHLASCPACRAEWASFRKAMQGLADLGRAEPSPGFAERVRQRLEVPTRWRRLLQCLFLPLHVKVPIQAVAMVLLAFAGLFLYQRSPELRRVTEPARVASPPTAPVAPAAPPPPAAGGPARTGEALPPRPETPTVKPAEPAAPPPPALAPAPQASLEAEKTRSPLRAGDEIKEAGKAPTPSESAKGGESPREFRAKLAEPGPAPRPPQPYAPAPAQSGGAAGPAQASPKFPAVPPSGAGPSGAPAGEGQITALQGKPADTLYGTALTDLAEKKYEMAIQDFRAFLARYPWDARAADARLRLGESYFGQGRYAEALQESETLVREFPSSPLVPAALYLQAQSRLAQGDRSGCRLLQDVVDQYPQAPEAASARQMLGTRCP